MLEGAGRPIVLTLMSWRRPELVEPGVIRLDTPHVIQDVDPILIRFESQALRVDLEDIGIQDGRLRSSWGDRLYRLLFTAKIPRLKGSFTFHIGR